MRLVVSINTENAAFQDNPKELQEIIAQAAKKSVGIKVSHGPVFLFDSNGNKTGFVMKERSTTPVKPDAHRETQEERDAFYKKYGL